MQILIAVLLSAPITPASHTDCAPRIEEISHEIKSEIRHMEDTIDDVRSAHLRKRLRKMLRRLREDVRALKRESCNNLPPVIEPPIVVQPPVLVQPEPYIMDDSRFSQLISVIEGESFEKAKLATLRTGTSEQCITADQAKRVLSLMSFSSGKKKAASILVPIVVDRDALFTLTTALTFSSDKKFVNQLIQQGPIDPRCRY